MFSNFPHDPCSNPLGRVRQPQRRLQQCNWERRLRAKRRHLNKSFWRRHSSSRPRRGRWWRPLGLGTLLRKVTSFGLILRAYWIWNLNFSHDWSAQNLRLLERIESKFWWSALDLDLKGFFLGAWLILTAQPLFERGAWLCRRGRPGHCLKDDGPVAPCSSSKSQKKAVKPDWQAVMEKLSEHAGRRWVRCSWVATEWVCCEQCDTLAK